MIEKFVELSNVKSNYYLLNEKGQIRAIDGSPVFKDPANSDFVLLLSEKEQSYRRADLKKLVIKMFVPKGPFCWVFIDENEPGEMDVNKMRYQLSYDFSKMSPEEAEAQKLRCVGLFEWAKHSRKTGTRNISAASVLTYYYQFNPIETPEEQVLIDAEVTKEDFDWFWRQYRMGYNTSSYTPTYKSSPFKPYRGTPFGN